MARVLLEAGPTRAIERRPDQLARAAGQDNYEAVALLIELGFDVNARPRTAPAGWAEHHGQTEAQRLLESREHLE